MQFLGWKKYRSLEYIYTGKSTDFELSEQYCMQNQGSLASIHSASQNSLVKELIWYVGGESENDTVMSMM